ncbi:uncharacterized protein LOC112056126 isoform X2 [Bicyclus anynana]|uniref:Uncharacterized protein LOC112056126 isoform X2 n=1 Tax=Bicyclus anynana TaxID=110368 RepID=A0ABM3M5L9_BICAN|nr:uncharacterized protein LOC112056126 isoform X2 [Bicyclus anynana]
MMSRGRHSQSQGWDSMREDNDTTYDAQYPDDEVKSGGVQLDHCKLYITNVNQALNEEGLRAAFMPYGTIAKVYLSNDPSKKYALVTYETPGEAKMAMMKLNRTEPLKLNIHFAHKSKARERRYNNNRQESGSYRNDNRQESGSYRNDISRQESDNYRSDNISLSSHGRLSINQDDYTNGGFNDMGIDEDDEDMDFDPELDLERKKMIEQLELDRLKLCEEQVKCQQRMIYLEKKAGKKPTVQNPIKNAPAVPNPIKRCILPDGRVVIRNDSNRNADHQPDNAFNSAAGDSRALNTCSCYHRTWNEPETSGSSTPSTCVYCSEDRSVASKDKSPPTYDKSPVNHVKSTNSTVTESVDFSKTDKEYSKYSKTAITRSIVSNTDSKLSETVTKPSDVTRKRTKSVGKSDVTCNLKGSDLYSESDDESDETYRLILLRNADYMDIVGENLKVVVALSGYPKLKMRLKQMEQFQRSINSVIDMQLKAGMMKQTPQFLDYYLNRGAIVCICKDIVTRDWMVRITPGLQERMFDSLILLKAKVKRLCLAVIKIPKSCWPASAHDAFKLLQYFNPTLKTHLWKIYAQKMVDNVEVTSFLVDRVSGEIIRGPNFKNVIDYNQMEFELTGYTEIYYESFLSDMDEDLSSVASRIRLLEELRSEEVTPRNQSEIIIESKNETALKSTVNVKDHCEDVKTASIVTVKDEDVIEHLVSTDADNADDLKSNSTEVTYKQVQNEDCVETEDHRALVNEPEIEYNDTNTSVAAISDATESIIESNDNLVIGRNCNLNIDSSRGIAYYRRTNYLHIENELKMAIVLEGYPQNKLEGTHIRRLKHLFKEYLHKDMKMQRFANLIIPKFQDIYLSNGAVIYICDSLETKDYLTEVLPKFVTSTSLKLTFRDIRNLVRYTRIVMTLPKELAHVGSLDILHKLQEKYPKLKLDCWKYYSDVAGKQKRQFGVDPESLDVIKNVDFDPIYENEKISFRIIDRQKPEINYEESNVTEDNLETESEEAKKLRERILKTMYCVIEPEIINATLTKMRANHYSDVIADDFKLYVGPTNYPETRIDEAMRLSIKKTIENIVFEAIYNDNDNFIPRVHDFYLFDGVIFIICQDMTSRLWIEQNIATMNAKLKINLKATEFRGTVGIISMTVKTSRDYDDVVSILQSQNPRLRTKYWRKISTVKNRVKLDVVLQIDKLSAQVICDSKFYSTIDDSNVEFKLGQLKTFFNRKSLDELSKVKEAKKYNDDNTVTVIETKKERQVSISEEVSDNSQNDNSNVRKTQTEDKFKNNNEPTKMDLSGSTVFINSYAELKSDRDSIQTFNYFEENEQGFTKMILKVPTNILPDWNDGLDIILDMLEDKNPGLNTELWKVEKYQYNKGRFIFLIDKQSAGVIKGKHFDPTLGGEKLKFLF